jgi:hypothetical protein
MKRKLYIYQENINPEIAEIFSSFGDTITIESIEENMITVLDSDYYNEEPIDIYSFQELIQDDFGREVSIFIEPYVSEGFSLGLDLKEFLKEVPYGVYQFEDIITHVVLKDNKELKLKIIDYIKNKSNQDVIHTVREFINNSMNSSYTAKKLYMHRNTLNYRVDNFIESTNINVKTFKGANAVYMLFKY